MHEQRRHSIRATIHRWARSGVAITCVPLALVLSGLSWVGPRSARPLSEVPGSLASGNRHLGSARTESGLPDFLAQSITFISSDDGWLLGATRCPTGWCTAVRHTTDRGRYWSAVAAPPASISESSLSDITELHFANSSDGFAFDPGLWVTLDGAANWQRVNLHGAVLALAAAGNEAYAVVAPCWPFTSTRCSNPTRLYRSPVGADAWNEVSGVVLPGDQEDVTLDVRASAVYLLVGGTKYFVGAADGRHFAKQIDPCSLYRTGPGYWALADLAVPAAKVLVVLCGGGAAAGSEEKKLFVSTDGGRIFRQVATPPFEGDAGEVAAASPTTLAITANSGASWVFRTVGSDTKWSTSMTFRDGGAGFDDLSFTDSTHGAVIHAPAVGFVSAEDSGRPPDPGTLFLTDNGGASWQPVVVDG